MAGRLHGFMVLLAAAGIGLCGAHGGRVAAAATDPSALEQAIFTLINQERASHGVPTLRRDARVDMAARAHSADMALHQLFDHTGSDGSTPPQRMARAGYQPIAAWGENIAAGYTDAAGLVDDWMASASHRANILDAERRTADTGVGVALDAYGTIWITQDFGRLTGGSTGPPAAPAAFRARRRRKPAIRLTWDDRSKNESGFILERWIPSTGTFFRIGQTSLSRPNVEAYTDKGLARRTSYTYRLRAYNAYGESAGVLATASTR